MSTTGIAFKVDEQAIARVLEAPALEDSARIRQILNKAKALKGLTCEETGHLLKLTDPALLEELFRAARTVKEEVYGNRVVLFAPLYASNDCTNECLYCAYRASNTSLARRTLDLAGVVEEARAMIRAGQKRIVLVAGDTLELDFILEAIRAIYATKEDRGEIRRIDVELPPQSVEGYRRLKEAGIGTSLVFQETYHRATYEGVHTAGSKQDFQDRLECMDRTLEAGLQDVGIGALLGLADWRFEVLAMLQHAAHLERRFGCGPHAISVPRIEPTEGSALSLNPPRPVSDPDFRKLVAVLRLAVPYTGIVLSTREEAGLRRECLNLGVTQLSAGSRPGPGGYARENAHGAQFPLGDARSLDEVVRDLCEMDLIPSFCNGCYRLGRVGADFMDLAKPGDIKTHCHPNAVSTFQEYLLDYAGPATREAGQACIRRTLENMEPHLARFTQGMVARIQEGQRDVFC